MRKKNKAKQFRYSPGSGNTGKKGSPERKKATVKPARPTAEEEIERYYELVHLKVPGKSLSRISAFNIMVLCGMLAAFCVGSFAMEKPVFSQIEKRDLAKMPEFSASSLFKGSLTRDIETYFADTFPFREWLVTLSAVVDESRGIRMDDVRIVQPPGGEVQDIPADASLPENKNPTPPPSGNSLPAVSPDGSSSEDSSSEASRHSHWSRWRTMGNRRRSATASLSIRGWRCRCSAPAIPTGNGMRRYSTPITASFLRCRFTI